MISSRNEKELNKINKASNTVGILDSALFTGIFGLFLQESSRIFLEQIGRLILFPFAIVTAFTQTVLAWHKAYLDRKKGTIAAAIVETIALAGVVPAVIGGIFASTAFVLAAPAIFVAVMGFKLLFHAGSAIYNLGKAAVTNNDEDKAKFRGRAKDHAITATLTAIFAPTITAVMIIGKPVYAIAGVIAGAIGFFIGIFKGYKQYQADEASKKKAAAEQLAFRNSLSDIAQRLSQSKTVAPITSPRQDFSHSATRSIFADAKNEAYINDQLSIHKRSADYIAEDAGASPSYRR